MSDGFSLDPRRTALLAMDWQPGILDGMNVDAALDATARLVDAARAAGSTIVFVRVALTEAEFERVPPWSRFAEIARTAKARFTDGHPDANVVPRLAPRDGEIVVRKHRIGAFSTTNLDAALRERGVDTLVLAGVSTSGVVLSTVRDASDRDYRLAVVSDACADRDAGAHDVLMRSIFPRQATVVAAAEACRAFEAAGQGD